MGKIALIKKENNTFGLVNDSDLEEANKIKVGTVYVYQYSKPRNYEFHKKFFALIKLLFDNQEVYSNMEHLRNDLTIASGFYTVRYNFDGVEIIEPVSISFASMDNNKFEEYYNAVLNTICEKFNFDREDIINNVQQYF